MTSDRLGRVLAAAGALGGLLWAAIPVVGALAFYGVELGAIGLGGMAALGASFRFAGLSVIGLLAGFVGLYRWFPASADRWGRRGAVIAGVGIALLLPGSFLPAGTVPPALGALVPLAFFAGLLTVAFGSLGVGLAARRADAWPPGLALWFGLAMPIGGAVGGLAAIAGAGNLALVAGLLVPYGLAWAAIGTGVAAGRL